MSSSEILTQIAALEAERQYLWGLPDGKRSERELGRLRDIAAILDRLWDQRRAEKSGSAGLADIVLDRPAWEGRGHRGQYRATRRELAEMELEVGG